MSFSWPWLLLGLLLIPLLIIVYFWVLRRRRKYAVRYSSLSLIREALPKRYRWRQHLPFALFLVSVASLVTALARPSAEVDVPLNRTTIILAVDVSRSMCATDVSPNRLSVAQEASLAFVEAQADETRIGIVAFAGLAEVVVPPTNNKDVLTEAIENFTTSLGTAIGSATLKSIDAISEVNRSVASSGVDLSAERDEESLDIGVYQPDIIVLLTDGANSRGPQPIVAAQQAADRQVRVYTIGFGSDDPGQLVCSSQQIGGDAFSGGFGGFGGSGTFGGGGGRTFDGGGFGGGAPWYLLLDEDTLRGMAELTGGEYFRAQNADQLFQIFRDLPSEIVLQKESIEISFVFAILGAVFVILAVSLSVLWHRFP